MNRTLYQSTFEPSQLRHKGDLSPIKPREKSMTIYRHLRPREETPKSGLNWPRDNSYLRKRLDRAVEQEREQMLMKTGRTSIDNPEWMSTNFDYYRRSNYSIPGRQHNKQERFYDVLNNPKQISRGRNEDNYFIKMYEQSPQRPDPVSVSALRKTMQHSQLLHGEVAGKVGALPQRDYTIPRPLLKIGNKNSYVDTYSPF